VIETFAGDKPACIICQRCLCDVILDTLAEIHNFVRYLLLLMTNAEMNQLSIGILAAYFSISDIMTSSISS